MRSAAWGVGLVALVAPSSGFARPWAEAAADGSPPVEDLAPWVTPAPELVPPRTFLESSAFEARGAVRAPVGSDRWSGGGHDQRGVEHPPMPGILFVAFDAITLKTAKAGCPADGLAHAAKRCSSLLAQTTTFPGWGSGTERAAVFETVRQYYAPFNVVLTVNEPPEYVPYSMAVVSGTPDLLELPSGTCGMATLTCDGAKRNHVSFNFAHRCGRMADVIAQESAHHFGLSHTDDPSDLMYPSVTGGTRRFLDACTEIVPWEGIIDCPATHDAYCEGGMGKQQNSKAELLGVFGPRVVDDVKPKLVAITPEDGAIFRTTDNIDVSATVEEDTPFLGVRWTWTKGAPPQRNDEVYSACTNGMCRLAIDDWRDNKAPYPFVTLRQPPAGTYAFKFEAMDAYGNLVTQTLQIEVLEPGAPIPEPEPSGTTGEGGSASSGDRDDASTGGANSTSTTNTEPAAAGEGATAADTAATGRGTSGGDADPSEASACACRVSREGSRRSVLPAAGAGFLMLRSLGLRRRRRAPACA